MTARRGHRTAAAGVLFFSFLLSGCAGPPAGTLRSVNHLSFRSRDGVFLYRIPEGWFDASADDEAKGHAVWLVRENLSATLAVEEIRMDDEVRQLVSEGALLEVGRLLSRLRAGKNGLTETRAPEWRDLGSREVCLYELANPKTNEIQRVLLFPISDHIIHRRIIPPRSRPTIVLSTHSAGDLFRGHHEDAVPPIRRGKGFVCPCPFNMDQAGKIIGPECKCLFERQSRS
jgi:hypothetical protein